MTNKGRLTGISGNATVERWEKQSVHKRKNTIIFVVSCFLVISVCLFQNFSMAEDFGKVVSVTDGDTIKIVDKNGEQRKIRLYGIDAPEKGQGYGSKAEDMLSAMIAGKNVEYKIVDTDKYGRSIGYLYLNGVCINAAMVKSGFAWVYTKYCNDRICSKMSQYQNEAKTKGLGLWQDANAIPPWDWRHTKNGSNPLSNYSDNTTRKFNSSSEKTNSSKEKTIHVRGYTRKDGTYVRAHTRSARN